MMDQYQSSRRKFLKISALLPITSLLLSPAIAQFYTDSSETLLPQPEMQTSNIRADIRNLDFDSHDFLQNFR